MTVLSCVDQHASGIRPSVEHRAMSSCWDVSVETSTTSLACIASIATSNTDVACTGERRQR